ncbi:hypothetical protein D3C80_2022570 [compost metagenome]
MVDQHCRLVENMDWIEDRLTFLSVVVAVVDDDGDEKHRCFLCCDHSWKRGMVVDRPLHPYRLQSQE